MKQDLYFHKIQIEDLIRSSRRRIEHTRQMLRLSRVHIEQEGPEPCNFIFGIPFRDEQ